MKILEEYLNDLDVELDQVRDEFKLVETLKGKLIIQKRIRDMERYRSFVRHKLFELEDLINDAIFQSEQQ